jgi:hypothetical protein
MQLVSLHDRISTMNNQQLFMLAIEAHGNPSVTQAIDQTLDHRSVLTRSRSTQVHSIARPKRRGPSLLRWLDPATRPELPLAATSETA